MKTLGGVGYIYFLITVMVFQVFAYARTHQNIYIKYIHLFAYRINSIEKQKSRVVK